MHWGAVNQYVVYVYFGAYLFYYYTCTLANVHGFHCWYACEYVFISFTIYIISNMQLFSYQCCLFHCCCRTQGRHVARQLTMVRGVTPVLADVGTGSREEVDKVIAQATE